MTDSAAQPPRKVSNIAAGFMIGIAALLDLIQGFLDLTVLLAPLTYIVDFFAVTMFGVWFAIMGVSYFGGRKKLLKVVSVFSSMGIEFVPFLNGLPGITAGVVGVIVGTRLEERAQRKASKKINTQPKVIT